MSLRRCIFKPVLVILMESRHHWTACCAAALPFKELSRQYTPCAWALVPNAPEVLYIEDLTMDARSVPLSLLTPWMPGQHPCHS